MSKLPSLFNKGSLIVGLLAASAVVAASTYAMPGDTGGQGPGNNCAERHAMQGKAQAQKQARFQEMRAQRLAALKDKLRLQPSQEAAWQVFTQAVPGKGSMSRENRQSMRASFKAMTAPERMDMMLARADQRRAGMARRAEAVKQFYAQLSPEQQKVFDAEAMSFRQGHRHHGSHFRQQT